MNTKNAITHSDVGGTSVVRLVGEHDLSTYPELVQAIGEVGGPQVRIAVDLSEATFIDSTVLRAIVARAQEAEAFAIAAPPGTPPRRLLELTRLTDVYTVVDDLAGALELTTLPAAASGLGERAAG